MTIALASTALPASAGVIVNLSPATAVVNTTDTNGQTVRQVNPPADNSILPTKNITGNEAWRDGLTINITFTPAADDLKGTVLLIEIGGTANGTGLYLINGVPTLVSKQNSDADAMPSGLNDTDLSDNTLAIQAGGGPLKAGTVYTVAAVLSFKGEPDANESLRDDTATIAIDTGGEGKHIVCTSHALQDDTTNGIDWSGNQTVSVRTRSRAAGKTANPASGYLGGLSEDGQNSDGPFFTGYADSMDGCQDFAGTISQALLWNTTGMIPNAKVNQ